MSPRFDDDDEEVLDFVFDGGVVRASRQESATRPKVEALRQAIDAYRAGQEPMTTVQTSLGALEQSVGEVIRECGELMNSDSQRRDFFSRNLAVYQVAFEAILRMQTACDEQRMDWLQQGLIALEGAVDDINALVTEEDEEA